LCGANQIPFEVRDVSLMEFYRADEVFCTGTMGELVPVREIDGRSIAGPVPGPMTRRLDELFHTLTATEGELVM
jgi:branched-chain amino acid aminotransferase